MNICHSCRGSGEIHIELDEDGFDLYGQCDLCLGSGFLHESYNEETEREIEEQY
jgi:excinuclease UvrABC ATPase subunit|tara:strand:- start:1113 stop:1274 length:162 start_codon:yes stop_codon:yes gene_type:complete